MRQIRRYFRGLLVTMGALVIPVTFAQESFFDGDLCWGGPVSGATHSQLARSGRSDFVGPCRMFTMDTGPFCNPDTVQPDRGETFFYLVRGDTWGQDSSGRERAPACNSWSGIDRAVQTATTTRGHRVGVVCHNCYFDADSNENIDLANTKAYIQKAVEDGADAIELDLKYGEGSPCTPDVEVRHRDWQGPCLTDVLDHAPLASTDALLFIETKEVPTDPQLDDLLCLFLPDEVVTSECPTTPRYPEYARPGRPLVLRALWDRRDFLTQVHAKLRQPPFDVLREHVRLHLSFLTGDPVSYANIDAWAPSVDGFEFDYGDNDLLAKIMYVRSLGRQVAIFGNNHYCLGDAFVASMREEVDYLIVEYPVGMARRIIAEDNRLLYLNVWDQFEPWSSGDPGTVSSVSYWGWDSTTPLSTAVNASGVPSLDYWSRADAQDLYGAVLVFDETQRLAFADDLGCLDNWSCGGYLVAAVLNHDGEILSQDDIVSKAENSGFYLDIQSGNLRFGVHVGGSYRTAYLSDAFIDNANSYLVVGAYDGHGRVRLWINDGEHSAASGSDYHGGVETNANVPVMVGADPDAAGGAGSYFQGKMQIVSVLAWGNHPVPPDQVKRYDGHGNASCDQTTPHIDIEKAINPIDPMAPSPEEDADCPPGPELAAGSSATFTYLVTNPGSVAIDMTLVTVIDDNGTPGDAGDDFAVQPVLSGGFNIGDTNANDFLDTGETWLYEHTTSATGSVYRSEARVVPSTDVSDCDPNHYTGPPD
jgi:hypothetical protein